MTSARFAMRAGHVASMIATQERAGRGTHDDQPNAAGTSLPADERSHAASCRR